MVELVAGLDAFEPDVPRRTALRALLDDCAGPVEARASAADLLGSLPALIHARMSAWGWAWNGFYVHGEDQRLHLGHAFGPPVCAELELSGGPLSSGMCFDALLLDQVLVVPDVKAWPGYVSCDAESGLSTVGGIVCPLHDAHGRVLGVWDLDSTAPVTAAEGRFIEALFASLERVLGFEAADLGWS